MDFPCEQFLIPNLYFLKPEYQLFFLILFLKLLFLSTISPKTTTYFTLHLLFINNSR